MRRSSPRNALAFTRMAVTAGLASLVVTLGHPALADGELNLYSSRHYDTDEKLYSEFTKKTGIKINRIEDKASALMKRIKAEGANSPADVLLTVDIGRLWAAERDGMLQPTKSEALNKAIPAHLRDPDGHWFGFSTRARVIFYDKDKVKNPPKTYQDLADPRFKGMVCTRSSSNIYMLSLLAGLIEHLGEDKAKAWAKAVYENRARDPQGGDTDQLRGIASGECAVAVSNTYYFARALRKDVRDLTGKTDKIGIVFPNQDTFGAHVNISGGGVVKTAPNAKNAVAFLEYLASASAQNYFAAGNDEYPVVAGATKSASVTKLGEFKADTQGLDKLGENQAKAQKIYNEVGYK
ncbi:MAG: Fe(3+) ABC transporter substrate-binding protein [Hyphomicrobiales bacterium]|nr:Fe(3+) ABC transporter substrate-binding protein [Hyphomicrobiales bacterium]